MARKIPFLIFFILSFMTQAKVGLAEQDLINASKNVTLELQSANILDVLKILSKHAGLNIVAGKNVQGQVSIFLDQVKVMDALRSILEITDLAYSQEGGIIKVMSRADYEQLFGQPYDDRRITRHFPLQHISAEALTGLLAPLKSSLGKIITEPRSNYIVISDTVSIVDDMAKLIEESDAPFQSKVFRLKYSKAEDLEPKLAHLFEASKDGSFETDKASNVIFIRAREKKLEEAEELIFAFDVRQPQVLIEAKIVEVSLMDDFRFGINWDFVLNQLGSFNNLSTAAAYAVAPPAGAALTAIQLGSGEDDLQLVIQMVERMGKANTLASPRITVLNREEAKLSVATKQPFVSQTVVQSVNAATTADNVQFVDVGVTLKVLPVIARDNFIQMKIRPEVSTSGIPVELEGVSQGSNTAFTRTIIPVVTTQQLETTVLAKSGTTLVVGGLIQDDYSKTIVKLPVLGNIPIIGRLFSSKANDFSKKELVLFITPTILEPDITDKKELRRYLSPKGELLAHEKVGGYGFEQASIKSQGPLRIDDQSYWEKRSSLIPRYWPSKEKPNAS